MKKRKYIAWFLMVVSLVMLTASVFPHHHHEDLLCLQHDVVETSTDCHDEEKPSDANCQACCVTIFHCSDPDTDYDAMEPHYSLESILFTITDLYQLPLRPDEECVCDFPFYHEKLHSRLASASMGLRAPPAVVLI